MSVRLTRPVLGALGAAALIASASACSMLGGGDVPTVDVGTCMNIADLEEVVEEYPEIDCAEPHDTQVFHKFDVADADEFPGAEALDAESEACIEQFEPYVGTPYEESALYVSYVGPSEESWDAGDREIVCVAYYDDGTTTTESFEGSGL